MWVNSSAGLVGVAKWMRRGKWTTNIQNWARLRWVVASIVDRCTDCREGAKMSTFKKDATVKRDLFPQRLELGEKLVVDLKPTVTLLSYVLATMLVTVGATLLGAGFSWADTRSQANKQSDYTMLTKADASTAKLIVNRMNREDADVIAWRDKAPLPPAGLLVGGLAMLVCGVGLGWVTLYKHCFV